MAFLLKKNNAKSTLNIALTINALSLQVVSASTFPTSGDFLVTIWDKTTYPDPSDDSSMEIVLVTAVSGNTFTITRGQCDTIAKAHSKSSAVELLIVKEHFDEIESAITSGGEINTASNLGSGIGVYKQKVDVDLQFKSLKANSSKIIIVDDVLNNEVNIDVSVSKNDVGLGNVDNISEATIITDVKADSDVSDALSKRHSHANQAALDLVSGTNTGDQVIPDKLSDLSDDSTHRLVTDTEKSTWNGKTTLFDVKVDSDVADAISEKHIQGTDQGLDTGGANAVTAAQAKTAYTHSQITTGNPHNLDASDVGALANVVEDLTPQLGGELDCQTYSIGSTLQSISSTAGVATIDWRNGNIAKIILTENISSLSFINPTKPGIFDLIIVQGVGNYTITWPNIIKFNADLYPVLSANANHITIFRLDYDGSKFYTKEYTEYTPYTLSDVVFENLVNGTASENSFTSTNVNGHCSGTIPLAENGFVEYKLGIYDRLSLGLSNQFENVLTDYDYNFYVGTSYVMGIYENNVLKNSPGTAASGGIVRIERVNGNTIKYYYNGVLKYTSLTTTTNPLILNIWVLDNGETISNVKIAQ